MRAVRLPFLAAAIALVAGSAASSQTPAPMHHVVSGKAITWTASSAMPASGVQIAVLHGDPSKEGAFTIRIKLPNATKVPAHWHPTDENLTVIQGTFQVGTGEKYDVAALKPMMAGDYAFMPKEMRHFALTKGETIVQVSGMGPFVTNWVNPEDDPRNKKPTSNQ